MKPETSSIPESSRMSDYGEANHDRPSELHRSFRIKIREILDAGAARGLCDGETLLFVNRMYGYDWDRIPYGEMDNVKNAVATVPFPFRVFDKNWYYALVRAVAALYIQGKWRNHELPNGVDAGDVRRAYDTEADELRQMRVAGTIEEHIAMSKQIKTVEEAIHA
jgi:hypothetical protein